MDQTAYLARIRYHGPLEPTPAVLAALHRAHLYAVPFENLDISLGRTIRLDEAALFTKIVDHRRGGFCYELNGLFARLLQGLGYRIRLLNARGVNDDGSYSREFDHLALQVRCPDVANGSWLVDIGWGNGPLEPLKLETFEEQQQGERIFRMEQAGDYQVLAERNEQGAWIKHYAFTLQPHTLEEFADCCHYHQTSPQSMFTRKRLCTLYLPQGRVTLSDLHLITTHFGVREEQDLSGEEVFRDTLRSIFDIDLDL